MAELGSSKIYGNLDVTNEIKTSKITFTTAGGEQKTLVISSSPPPDPKNGDVWLDVS